MASGTLGRAVLTSGNTSVLYTVPISKIATMNLNVVNRGANAALLRVALSTSNTASDSEWIEYNTTISSSGVLERTGLVASANTRVLVYSSVNDVTATVYGYEE